MNWAVNELAVDEMAVDEMAFNELTLHRYQLGAARKWFSIGNSIFSDFSKTVDP